MANENFYQGYQIPYTGVSSIDADIAAGNQEVTSNMNNSRTWGMYERTRQDYQPYVELGTSSLADLGQVAGQTPDYSYSAFQQSPESQLGNMGDFQTDPGYEFTRSEGTRGLENKLSGMGMNNSGRALKELDRYNTGLADQQYGDWYARQAGEYGNYVNRLSGEQTNQYNQYMGLAGLGSGAIGQTGAYGQSAVNSINQNNQYTTDANAAAAMNQSDSGLNTALQLGGLALGMYNTGLAATGML